MYTQFIFAFQILSDNVDNKKGFTLLKFFFLKRFALNLPIIDDN